MLKKSFRATKCKTVLRLAISRMKLVKNTRETMIKQMKKDLANLLQSGKEGIARIRVEHIIREQNLLTAYELVEIFCELIIARLSIIKSQKMCPIDLKEAISTVIFSAPRCPDLPELLDIQRIFGSKYGTEFIAAAADLRPECGVNRNVVEKLSTRPPSNEVRLKVLKQIAEEHQIEWHPVESEEEFFKIPGELLDGPEELCSATEISDLNHKHSTSPAMQATDESSTKFSLCDGMGQNQWARNSRDASSTARAAAYAAEKANISAKSTTELLKVEKLQEKATSEANSSDPIMKITQRKPHFAVSWGDPTSDIESSPASEHYQQTQIARSHKQPQYDVQRVASVDSLPTKGKFEHSRESQEELDKRNKPTGRGCSSKPSFAETSSKREMPSAFQSNNRSSNMLEEQKSHLSNNSCKSDYDSKPSYDRGKLHREQGAKQYQNSWREENYDMNYTTESEMEDNISVSSSRHERRDNKIHEKRLHRVGKMYEPSDVLGSHVNASDLLPRRKAQSNSELKFNNGDEAGSKMRTFSDRSTDQSNRHKTGVPTSNLLPRQRVPFVPELNPTASHSSHISSESEDEANNKSSYGSRKVPVDVTSNAIEKKKLSDTSPEKGFNLHSDSSPMAHKQFRCSKRSVVKETNILQSTSSESEDEDTCNSSYLFRELPVEVQSDVTQKKRLPEGRPDRTSNPYLLCSTQRQSLTSRKTFVKEPNVSESLSSESEDEADYNGSYISRTGLVNGIHKKIVPKRNRESISYPNFESSPRNQNPRQFQSCKNSFGKKTNVLQSTSSESEEDEDNNRPYMSREGPFDVTPRIIQKQKSPLSNCRLVSNSHFEASPEIQRQFQYMKKRVTDDVNVYKPAFGRARMQPKPQPFHHADKPGNRDFNNTDDSEAEGEERCPRYNLGHFRLTSSSPSRPSATLHYHQKRTAKTTDKTLEAATEQNVPNNLSKISHNRSQYKPDFKSSKMHPKTRPSHYFDDPDDNEQNSDLESDEVPGDRIGHFNRPGASSLNEFASVNHRHEKIESTAINTLNFEADSLPAVRSSWSKSVCSERGMTQESTAIKKGSNDTSRKVASHVHPKLPDYDNIAAMFAALKANRH